MNSLFFNDLKLIQKDDRQFAAYNSMTNTVVIAGPGSGKTRVLTLKAITLAKSHIKNPCGIACISFSRETVRELKKRLGQYGYNPSNKDFIGTVHSFSLLHVIKPFAHLYPQYNVHYPIKILPDNVRDQIYHSVLSELNIEDNRLLTLSEISKHRSLSLPGRSNVHMGSTRLISSAALIYEKYLYKTVYLDFISIINISAKIICEQEFVRMSLQSRFPWLLIDEYQDLGKALHEMVLELIFNAEMKLYAVGDVNQSIYGFNGGYPDFLQELTENDDITTINLEANYRSTQQIIEASLETLQLIPPFPKYTAEKRKDELADFAFITCDEEMDEQYEVVSKKIVPKLLLQGIPLNEIGILTNSNVEIQHLANFLQAEKIPFFIATWNFENSAVVVWLQDCALWCHNQEKQSFNELFKFWMRLLSEHNDKRKGFEKIRLKTILFNILSRSRAKVNTLEWLKFIIVKLDIKTTLADSEIYPNEIKNLDRLLEEAKLHNLKNSSIQRFANLGTPDNEVTITTRHSSKGLEFEVVIMLGMEEERFPYYSHLGNPIALAEDQRLCYVCISRAKKSCILVRSKIFSIPTKRGDIWRKIFNPSRFWVSLYNKFGNPKNSFTNKNYI